jgi:DNA-binding MarR family transcriptional regulator
MKMDTNISTLFFNKLENSLKQYKKYVSENLVKHHVGVTFDQWRVLEVILLNKGIKQTEIAEKTSKDTASVTRIIDILNKKGYVARQTDPENRRKHSLGVSYIGEKVYYHAKEVIDDAANNAVKDQKPKRLDKLEKVLKKISKNCG